MYDVLTSSVLVKVSYKVSVLEVSASTKLIMNSSGSRDSSVCLYFLPKILPLWNRCSETTRVRNFNYYATVRELI